MDAAKYGKELPKQYCDGVYGKKPAALNDIPDFYDPEEKFLKRRK